MSKREMLENRMRELTIPIGAVDDPCMQYPRPWMTTTSKPENAAVFIVGFNQATTYCSRRVDALTGGHNGYIRALFNDDPERGCHWLYRQVRDGQPDSPTRVHIESITSVLSKADTSSVLETNVVCYSSAAPENIALETHAHCRTRGREIFYELLAVIRPTIIISHGVETSKELEAVLRVGLPSVSTSLKNYPETPLKTTIRGHLFKCSVISIPHLSRHVPRVDELFERVNRTLASK